MGMYCICVYVCICICRCLCLFLCLCIYIYIYQFYLMYTDRTSFGPFLTCRWMKQPFRKIFPSSHPNWQRHHHQDIVMAAMCNRGDALMYATEFSQASKPWLSLGKTTTIWNQMVPSFYHISWNFHRIYHEISNISNWHHQNFTISMILSMILWWILVKYGELPTHSRAIPRGRQGGGHRRGATLGSCAAICLAAAASRWWGRWIFRIRAVGIRKRWSIVGWRWFKYSWIMDLGPLGPNFLILNCNTCVYIYIYIYILQDL